MAKSRQSAKAPRRQGFARIDEIGDDGMRLRTIWNPLPAWLVPIGFSAVIGGLAVAIAAASGANGNSLVEVLGYAVLGAYAGGAIIWAVVGAAGGDRLEILFDGASETATVDQRLLWRWGRHWQFDLDDVERVYVWSTRGRFSLRLSQTHFAAIGFYERPPLSLGRYHTDPEVMEAALPVGSFVGVPVRRNERPPKVAEVQPDE
jgi:hypothetical protein